MANGNRNALGAIGGLTQGLFRGVTTGIGLQQRQQALDREKLESELGLFNVIAKLPDGPFKKASMGRFLPRIGFSQESTDLLLKANEEEQGYLNKALQNIMEQLPEGMGASGFKDLVGRLTPEQILKLVDVGLKVEKFKSETATTKMLGQIGAGGFGEAAPAEPQQPMPQGGVPGTQAPASPFDQRIANLDMAIAKATAIGTDDALKLVRVLQSQRDNLAQDRRRFEGMSPAEFTQRLDISRQTGAEAIERKRELEPLSSTDLQAIQVHTQNLANLTYINNTFTDKELEQFVGLLNRPTEQAKLIVRGISGKKGSERYADFKAANERLRASAFGEGGKQLTPFEASVVFGFTPTGREAGGATEYRAKARNLERFAKGARKLRLDLSRQGKGTIDLEKYDQELQSLYKDIVGSKTKGSSGVDYIYDPKTGTLKKVGE